MELLNWLESTNTAIWLWYGAILGIVLCLVGLFLDYRHWRFVDLSNRWRENPTIDWGDWDLTVEPEPVTLEIEISPVTSEIQIVTIPEPPTT